MHIHNVYFQQDKTQCDLQQLFVNTSDYDMNKNKDDFCRAMKRKKKQDKNEKKKDKIRMKRDRFDVYF